MSNNGSIFISAGDPSADFPGKLLIDEIARACPGIEVIGLGGPMMQAAGLKPIADHRDLAVIGFWEVLPKFLFFRRILNRSANLIEEKRPRAVILLDYPGFNLRLAKRIKTHGIPIIYYISPQVWAWGKGRIGAIRELIDLMLVIFPFEEKFFVQNNIAARFTGHPVVDRYGTMPGRDDCRRELEVGGGKKLIGLLPGSRLMEIKRMLPDMVGATGIIRKKIPDVEFIVAAADGIDRSVFETIIGGCNIRILTGKTPEIIKGADLVVTASGTATVETAYFETPMVVIYKTGFLTYQIARRLVKLDVIGMVNIVAGRKIVPELIQNEASAEAIAEEVLNIIEDESRYTRMKNDLAEVRHKLGEGGAGRGAFEAINERVRLC